MFFPQSFIALHLLLSLQSSFHKFLYKVWDLSFCLFCLLIFTYKCQLLQHYLWNRQSFLHWITPLSKILWAYCADLFLNSLFCSHFYHPTYPFLSCPTLHSHSLALGLPLSYSLAPTCWVTLGGRQGKCWVSPSVQAGVCGWPHLLHIHLQASGRKAPKQGSTPRSTGPTEPA